MQQINRVLFSILGLIVGAFAVNQYNTAGATQMYYAVPNNSYTYVNSNMGKCQIGIGNDLHHLYWKDTSGTIYKLMNGVPVSSNTGAGQVFFSDSNGNATSSANFGYTGGTLYLAGPVSADSIAARAFGNIHSDSLAVRALNVTGTEYVDAIKAHSGHGLNIASNGGNLGLQGNTTASLDGNGGNVTIGAVNSSENVVIGTHTYGPSSNNTTINSTKTTIYGRDSCGGNRITAGSDTIQGFLNVYQNFIFGFPGSEFMRSSYDGIYKITNINIGDTSQLADPTTVTMNSGDGSDFGGDEFKFALHGSPYVWGIGRNIGTNAHAGNFCIARNDTVIVEVDSSTNTTTSSTADPRIQAVANGDHFPRLIVSRINGASKTNATYAMLVGSTGLLEFADNNNRDPIQVTPNTPTGTIFLDSNANAITNGRFVVQRATNRWIMNDSILSVGDSEWVLIGGRRGMMIQADENDDLVKVPVNFQVNGMAYLFGGATVTGMTTTDSLTLSGHKNGVTVACPCSLSGCTGVVAGTMYWSRSGNQITVMIPTLTGTVNSTTALNFNSISAPPLPTMSFTTSCKILNNSTVGAGFLVASSSTPYNWLVTSTSAVSLSAGTGSLAAMPITYITAN